MVSGAEQTHPCLRKTSRELVPESLDERAGEMLHPELQAYACDTTVLRFESYLYENLQAKKLNKLGPGLVISLDYLE